MISLITHYGACISRLTLDLLRFRFRWGIIKEQIFRMGFMSLFLIGSCLTFVSLMLILEFSFHIRLVLQQDSLVPAFSTVLILRELGPVVSCLLFASRIGASMASEISVMKFTEQLDAFQVLSIDFLDYYVIPRWIACVVSCMALTVFCIFISIGSGAAVASLQLHSSFQEFFHSMFLFTRFYDFLTGVIKANVFATIIAIVSSHAGLQSARGSQGVGQAATQAVVQSTLWIIFFDFLLTFIFYTV